MSEMVKRLAKLIDLKTIVTLIIVSTLAMMTWKGLITAEQFIPIAMVVIGSFFGYQNNKKGGDI